MTGPRKSGRLRRWGVFLTVLGFAGGFLVNPSAWAEPVKVRAALHDDFGRIVFSWNTPVGYKSAIQDDRLTVRFGRTIEASFGRITRTLGKYISAVSPGDDGRSVVFTLKGDFDAYSFDSGNAVIVEIANKEPEKPGEPKKVSGKKTEPRQRDGPSDLPSIRVRTGQHAAYTRIVFDWPRKVPYTFKQEAGVATVTFARPARLNLKAIQSRPPRYIGGVRSRISDDGVTVTLAVPETSKVKHFLAGPKVVLDVGRPSGSEKAAALPPEEAKKAKQAKQAKAPAEAPKALKPDQEKTSETLAEAPKAKEAGASLRTPGQPQEQTKEQAQGKVEGQSVSQETKTAAAESTSPPAAPGLPTKLTPKALTPPAAGPVQEGAAPAPGALQTPGAPPPLPPTPSQVTAKAPEMEESLFSLRFDWDEPVGAAVFRRAGFLWVAFDKPTAIDVNQLRQTGASVIKGIEQMGTTEATVLRMATAAGINPSLRRDGLAWLLDFRKQPMEATTQLIVKAQPESPVGSRLFVPVVEPGTPIAVTDPEVGDNIVIVPVLPLGHGTGLEYIYPQLRILQSSQGLAVQPKGDDIRVRSLREGLEITSGNELLISEVSSEAEAHRQLASMKPLTRILDLEKWEIENIDEIRERRHELLAATTKAKGPQLEAARMDLAQFYFANGFYTESMAVLHEAAKDRIEIEQVPEYRMLKGVAQYMLGRYSEATESLTHEALMDNDEAIFWRAAVRATSGDLAGAAMDLRRTGPLVRTYPKNLKTPMGTLVTKSVLEIGDVKQARHWLEILRLDDLTTAGESQLDFEEGRVLELTGDFDGAIKIWEKVKEGTHRPSQGRAIVARMELLLKLGRADRKEAIEDLEGLRFKWRGDEFEFNMLRRLGSLYLEEGLYREGLDRLRQAATYYRTHEEAPQVTQKMSDAFNSLFLDEGADALPPINTISIYDEFKELTPAGAQGDEMIRKLADRLVGVDLLDRAANLLSSQVRFRLKGLEKARVGTQLALIRVLDREYESALNALDETVQPNLPDPLITQRRHIRANSLLGLDRHKQAMDILKNDKSHDAELIRTEAFWGTQDWSQASRALRRLIRLTGAKPGEKLDQRQASFVLNYAITLTLSGNERALRRLHSDFGGAMGQTNLKDAFRLIVTPPSLGLFNPANVAAGVKEVENFQSFMSAYRERLKKQSLSELVPGSMPTDEKETENQKPEGEAPEATQPPTQTPARAIPQALLQPQPQAPKS